MMSELYQNSKTLELITDINSNFILEDENDTLTQRCKFNFHYFTLQKAGQDFQDWNHQKLIKLLNKLKNYNENSLAYWQKGPIGKGSGHVLEIYGNFPQKQNTDFISPKSIPLDVRWGRFRLDSASRLVGFVVPDKLHNTFHSATGEIFDKNTFYIVFLDKDHKFYKMEKK